MREKTSGGWDFCIAVRGAPGWRAENGRGNRTGREDAAKTEHAGR